VSLADRWRTFRAGLIADRRFRRFAARNPITRGIARKRAAALFDLCAGFVYSQVVSAFVRLGLVDLLAAAPLTAREIAHAVDLPAERVDRLMRAAAALGLAEARSGDRYGLGELGAALVDNDGVRAMIEHHDLLYRDLQDPVALLRGEVITGLSRYWSYAGDSDGDAGSYSRLMARSQAFVADEVLDSDVLANARHVLDVGGGSGAFVEAAVHRHRALAATLFDLPAVASLARDRLRAAGIADRVAVVAGDLRHDPLPGGADLVTLVRVLHDHDDAVAAALLSSIHRTLAPGGRLIVAEPMAGTRGAEASGDAYFGFYLLAMGQGRPRRFDEIADLAKAAGFRRIREIATATPLVARILVASD
jgi:demethylspheroidene O-methyltransferase